jgi:purine nucleosidase
MSAPAQGRTPILIDCDTGIDDALALLYACGSSDAELLGVTCVGGNVDARQVAENTRAVLELAGRTDVEVALGREVPIARQMRTAPETHGPRGLGFAELAPAARPLSNRHAADLIIDTVRARPGDLTLVTLGPLTNLALAVLREPELPRLLRKLVMMVGSYRSAGNTAPTTEWNAAVDPEALAIVLRAWANDGPRAWSDPPARPLALGLDVTERAKLTPDHLRALTGRAGGPDRPIVRLADDALRFYMEFHSRYDGFYGAFIHDPLAMAVALDPTLARTESLTVEVELGGAFTTGETVTDWRRSWGRPANLDVVVDADIDAFFERFIERVGDLAASVPNVAPYYAAGGSTEGA